MRIIDLGCGAWKKIPGSTGLDIVKGSCTDIQWDMDKMPWPIPDGSYDLAVCNEAVEHLADIRGFLNETRRILDVNGILVLTTNNEDSLINAVFHTYRFKGHKSLQNTGSLKHYVSQYFHILSFFMLPYDRQPQPDLRVRNDLRFMLTVLPRRILHSLLPEFLQERMVVVAMKY